MTTDRGVLRWGVLGTGWIGGNLFLRRQPGHVASANTDYGAAVRFTLGF